MVKRDQDIDLDCRQCIGQRDPAFAAKFDPCDVTLLRIKGKVAALAVRQQGALAEPAHAKSGEERKGHSFIERERGRWPGRLQIRAIVKIVGQARPPIAPRRRATGWAYKHKRAGLAVQYDHRVTHDLLAMSPEMIGNRRANPQDQRIRIGNRIDIGRLNP